MSHVLRRITAAKVNTLKNDLLANLANKQDYNGVYDQVVDTELFEALENWLGYEDANDPQMDD